MELIDLELHNVRSLRNFKFEFQPGVTGVVGPNYIGKSNFSSVGTDFLLTGNTGEVGKKDNMLTWGQETGYGNLQFLYGGSEWSLRRNLHNSHVSLTDGKDTWTKPAEVEEVLEEIYGAPLTVVSELCFVKQFHLTDVLEMTRAKRVEWFLRMIGGEQARKLRDKLQTTVNKIPVYTDRSDDIKETEKQLEECRAQYKTMNTDLQESRKTLEGLKEGVEEAGRKTALPMKEDVETEIKDLKKDLDKNLENRKKYEKENNIREVPEPEGFTEDEQKYLRWVREYEPEYRQVKQELSEKSLDEFDRNNSLPDEPDKKPEDINTDIKIKDETRKNLLEDIECFKKGVCPRCKRPFTEKDAEHRVECEGKLKGIDRSLKELRKEFEIVEENNRKYREIKKDLEDRRSRLESRISFLRERVDKLEKSGPVEDHDKDELEKRENQQDEYRKYVTALDKFRKDLEKFDREKARLEARIETLDKQECVSRDEKERAQKHLKEYERASDEVQDTRKELAVLTERGKGLSKNLEKYREEMEKGKKSERLSSFFQEAREVLHRDRLPRAALEQSRRKLNRWMSGYLEVLECGFQARVDEDMDFTVDFENGASNRPVGDLSGGQKIMLSVPFHLAKARLFPLPLLVLDEPSFYIARQMLPKVSEVVREFNRECGHQFNLLMPTHEVELHAACDRIFNMEEQQYV